MNRIRRRRLQTSTVPRRALVRTRAARPAAAQPAMDASARSP